ncbi:hypothetical protein DWC19_04900 [Streptomyces sp. M7]|nr:hypothetical protein DWC19_04900 [Streptomyces sp. M7]
MEGKPRPDLFEGGDGTTKARRVPDTGVGRFGHRATPPPNAGTEHIGAEPSSGVLTLGVPPDRPHDEQPACEPTRRLAREPQ